MKPSILLVVAAVGLFQSPVEVEAASLLRKERKGFIFLGSTNKPADYKAVTEPAYIVRNYWMSINAASYAEAQRDCKENGDRLLQIETFEEWMDVESWLQETDQSASLAWVGGRYQVRNETFLWENGNSIAAGLWAPGQPLHSKPNSRVVASTVGQIIQLKSQPNTQASRYICEGQ